MVYKKEELDPIDLEIRKTVQSDPAFGLLVLILVKKQNGKPFPEKFTLQDLILNFEPTDKDTHFSNKQIEDCFENMCRLKIIKKCDDENKYFVNRKLVLCVGEDVNKHPHILVQLDEK